jgi:hypothetical protein
MTYAILMVIAVGNMGGIVDLALLDKEDALFLG